MGRRKLRVFVDPLCTRPIFYRSTEAQLLFADKLSARVSSADDATLNWDAVLEANAAGDPSSQHVGRSLKK